MKEEANRFFSSSFSVRHFPTKSLTQIDSTAASDRILFRNCIFDGAVYLADATTALTVLWPLSSFFPLNVHQMKRAERWRRARKVWSDETGEEETKSKTVPA